MKRIKNQKGVALVLSLMVILVLSVMASGLMFNIINEKTITANRMRSSQALLLSKAGTSEAIARLSQQPGTTWGIAQDISSGSLNPEWRCYITLDAGGSPEGPIVYAQTLQTGTALQYSTNRNALGDTFSTLQVRYKRIDLNGDGAITNDEVYFYDYKREMVVLGRTSPTPVDAYPIWEIISTGRVGNSRRTMVTEVSVPSFNTRTRAGLSSKAPVTGNGNADVCGHDHPQTTPYNLSPPNCFTLTTAQPHGWHVAAEDSHGIAANSFANLAPKATCTQAGCLPGIETNATFDNVGANRKAWGNPDVVENSTSPIYPIWEMLGMEETACKNLPWGNNMYPVTGLVRVGSPGTTTMYAGGGSGLQHDGILWVLGNLHSASNISFKGLIYIEGNYQSGGTTWVLGGIVVQGATQTSITGSIDVLYSSQTLARVSRLANAAGMVVLSQREVDQKF
ncbi:MAG: pilus assembly PilX N-terminal domain-containing protein [Candidatus Edwardsbacteria bacterium]|nr:pilus assembly PilX N-terminal domain-containing protein [Candidatus Edwardsbacteria bacterium]MBU1577552.1 pilus assembly PilX N-terminal domain-containing protein [Candidatus Edwardsbacteria bacterium]MBU2462510.1 pilus assembly PilX N-terminal domain-containing protein [Candidatus Edwardsbacteria bacterium]MBU2593647.1 pilus assembly PilX N-terminal domain-containing protein [Candidatus Edwardsbacteria bacterium]